MKVANCKITVQCERTEDAKKVIGLLEHLDEYELFSTGIQDNTREPFKEGVHLSIFYRLPEDSDIE